MKNNACDDLRFSVMIYITTKDYSWGNEIIMGRIEKKWVFRVGSEKHEADNCVIVNLPEEASGRGDGESSTRGNQRDEKSRDCEEALRLVVAYSQV